MTTRNTAKRKRVRRLLRTGLAVLGVLGLLILGLLGWRWLASLRVERIALAGAHHADASALQALARVDTGQVLLGVDPALVADRLRRHPWVAGAVVRRLPTGTLALTVQERMPTVLVLDGAGRPSHYFDRYGFAMPAVADAAYDVPLLHGLRERYHPVRRVQDAAVRDLLAALADAPPEVDALVSDVEQDRDGQLWLVTTPAAGHGALRVQFGRGDAARKLGLLHAFWHQAVRNQPEKTYTLIDLRFNSQIVTRETVRGR